MRRPRVFVQVKWFVVGALVMGSCNDDTTADTTGDGSTDTDALPEVDYEADIQPIFNQNCLCHLQGMSGEMTADYMTLNPGVSHGQIVGVRAEGPDNGINRIEPGELERSYMWRKIHGTHVDVGGVGDRMPPPPVPMLDDDARALIRAWILRGANP